MFEPDWARHCADVAVERVKEATGRDIWAELGGCPRSWREASALYRRFGVRSLQELVAKAVLGPPVAVGLARRGDICAWRGSLGICRGDLVEFADVTIALRLAERAWRVDGRPR